MRGAVQVIAVHAAAASADVWTRHASHWHLLRSPLRPSAEDVEVVQRQVDSRAATAAPLRALLLGVTPELVGLRWPAGSRLVAVDRSSGMLRTSWNPPASVAALPVQAEWGQLPAAAGTFDLVMADGSLNVLPDPAATRELLAQLARVLGPGGRMVARCFARPEARETPVDVLQRVRECRIGSIHVAKFRLAMALQSLAPAQGVLLDDVWRVFRAAEPDSRALALRTGWSIAEIETIDAYRGVLTRFVFPTLPEWLELTHGSFVVSACHVPGYEMGDRCPTLVLESTR